MLVTLQNTWFDGSRLWDRGTHEMDENVRDKLPPSAKAEEAKVEEEVVKPKAKSKLEL
jgi:hypothetical protein